MSKVSAKEELSKLLNERFESMDNEGQGYVHIFQSCELLPREKKSTYEPTNLLNYFFYHEYSAF